ncbi:MAG TPA: diguanylate cyclase, partial [Gemmatimonadaceae bacterium]|nr:diguanylate cyclase [Gemmatimonadaceae bacterium]
MAPTTAFIFAPDSQPVPAAVRGWLDAQQFPVATVRSAEELLSAALRSRPRLVVIDARTHPVAALKGCRRLKSDSYTGIVPVVVCARNDDTSFTAAFDAGADEVLRDGDLAGDVPLRLSAMLRRSDRDTHVHPSTRLPGTTEIEANIMHRLEAGELFAVCYADLDHFKEYNDRYSYYDGDRVIRILSRILHDVVKGTCEDAAFVGHIGGDDFLFVMPVEHVQETCAEV